MDILSFVWNSLILNPMINALLFLYQLLGGNFGLAIIVFTILIRLITYPLTLQTQKSAKAMQEMQSSKQWLDMKKKYAKDPQKMQAEQMKLMRASGANPLGGCLPTLIQLPIMIGLYQSVINAMNLAQPERLASPGIPFEIPVLAILVMITSWISQRMIPAASADPQGAQTALIMNIFMVFIITNISLTLASGLSLYFIVTNLFSMVQFMLMGKVDWRNVIGFGPRAAPAKK
jgi:YidC/Oxa1 family membrane protein insertase